MLECARHCTLFLQCPLANMPPLSLIGWTGVIHRHHLPVDSAGTLIRLDVHLVMVNVDLRNVHLKVVGQKLDWFAHSANARPARCLEHLLQGRQVGTCSY